ncbi:MAG: aminotransferase class I/II-fold pyridoxal phosphate-dependent enzyme [Treponema sp.]|jgi:histidinol-phosphate aminotransferase|nr:aminotransferase class I/II-fold pyridoxal phosphate-dependent enzyme [Treponema sp.]
MSRFWNARTRELAPYIPGEQPRQRAYIKLNTNENPYPPSPATLQAIARAAGEGLRLYPDPVCRELREAVAERWGVKPEQVFAGNGSDEVLAFAFAAFFETEPDAAARRGGAVLFPDITYSFYPVYARLWGVPYECPRLQDDFSIDHASFLTRCGGVVFPNPNAPTGIALPREHVLAIARYHAEQGAVVIVDEAYVDFARSADGAGGNVPLSVIDSIKDHLNLLVVRTLSKSTSLAGLRIGFAVGNEELIEGLCRVRDSFNSYPVDRLALAGAAAAVRDAAYYEETTRKIISTRERTAAALVEKGYTALPSSANFLFIRHPILTGAEFRIRLREAGILVRHFNAEGGVSRIADFVRVSIGTDTDMDAFLAACAKEAV